MMIRRYSVLALGLVFFWAGARAQSVSTGTVGKGTLKQGERLKYKGSNYRFFSPLSYFVLNRGYLNDRVAQVLQESYKALENQSPKDKFRVMECSRKHGGKMWPHRTHQNGLSVDFMTPLKKSGRSYYRLNWIGVWHYALRFDSKGRLRSNKKVEIDFERMANHLLALDKAAKKRGLRIKKVILKTDLKDEFFQTPGGKKLKARGVYFVRKLPDIVNNQHDDHYHVDFAFR